ncbi:MAG: hypothetical protein ACN6RA_14765 [Stenotrophomonas maltophilia]
MSYPANAFVRASVSQAPLGTLVYVRGFWTLNVEIHVPVGPKRKSLVMTGDNAGYLYDAFETHGLATAPEVGVEIRISEPEGRTDDGGLPQPGVVVIPADGQPEVWARLPDSEFYKRGFKLNGESVQGEEHEGRPYIYFESYEVWLTRDGKALSDKPLFVVGA